MEVHKGFWQRCRQKNKLESAFYGMHPGVIFLYFVGLFAFVFMWNHPVFSLTVMAFILLLDALYVEKYKMMSAFKGFWIVALLIILINPLTNHRGTHILFYLSDNPITLEAFLYGVSTSVMIFSMFMAFLVFNALIDSERFLFLFAKFFPKIGFITNMSIRYTSVFQKRAQNIIDVAKTRGIEVNSGKFRHKIETAGHLLKALISWCLEEGMMIAEVLKAKEYGQKRRTTYNRFKLISADICLAIVLVLSFTVNTSLFYYGAGQYAMYPRLLPLAFDGYDLAAYCVMIFYLAIPILVEFFYAWQRRKNRTV